MLWAQDLVWVHDYHLIPLGEELRKLGRTQPIGFFLHTPFPAAELFRVLPLALSSSCTTEKTTSAVRAASSRPEGEPPAWMRRA